MLFLYAGQPPGRVLRGAVDRASAITHLLKMLASWMPRTAIWRQRVRKPVAPAEYGPVEEAPTVKQIQEERQALKVPWCLNSKFYVMSIFEPPIIPLTLCNVCLLELEPEMPKQSEQMSRSKLTEDV